MCIFVETVASGKDVQKNPMNCSMACSVEINCIVLSSHEIINSIAMFVMPTFISLLHPTHCNNTSLWVPRSYPPSSKDTLQLILLLTWYRLADDMAIQRAV